MYTHGMGYSQGNLGGGIDLNIKRDETGALKVDGVGGRVFTAVSEAILDPPAEFIRRGVENERSDYRTKDAKTDELNARRNLRNTTAEVLEDCASSDEETEKSPEPKKSWFPWSSQIKKAAANETERIEKEKERAMERQRKLKMSAMKIGEDLQSEQEKLDKRVRAAQDALERDREKKTGWTWWR